MLCVCQEGRPKDPEQAPLEQALLEEGTLRAASDDEELHQDLLHETTAPRAFSGGATATFWRAPM